jgi:hypothetical protein
VDKVLGFHLAEYVTLPGTDIKGALWLSCSNKAHDIAFVIHPEPGKLHETFLTKASLSGHDCRREDVLAATDFVVPAIEIIDSRFSGFKFDLDTLGVVLNSVEQMVKVATALDDAGVPLIQVTHGAGLGGNSPQHGFAMAKNEEYLDAVCSKVKRAKVSVLLIPGLGTMRELQSAYDCGARSVHVATHCTEADTSPQHIACAGKLGMDTTGFLMMAHLNTPAGLAQQGKLMEGSVLRRCFTCCRLYRPCMNRFAN